jgi:peptidyl-prolyl cis-trans isomerase D
MITWMQRHRKYLVITIWISTIAFIGAGFVGWGQYSYGDKAGAVAKVGDVSITSRELQQTYSRLYNQYNRIFQGNFDEAQAKSFGLDKQALRQLIEQALILNLANSYNLRITEAELLETIGSQQIFYKNGKFDKETYQKALNQNNLTMQDYENDVRKALLIQKTLGLFAPKTLPLEKESLETARNIADKISYKILSSDMISIDTSDEALKTYWETRQQNYMTPTSYELEVVKQTPVSAEADDAAAREYYESHKTDFANSEGMILPFEEAKADVIAALDDRATNKASLRTYIAFKKGELDPAFKVERLTIDEKSNPFGAELFAEVTALNIEKPYLKPRKVAGEYLIIKLAKTNPSVPKSFEAAKADVLSAYKDEQQAAELRKLAENSLATFSGKTTLYLTREESGKINWLKKDEAQIFLDGLFQNEKKRGYVQVSDGKIVLFNILEQKLLENTRPGQEETVMRLKTSQLDRGLIKMLESKYAIETYIEGL